MKKFFTVFFVVLGVVFFLLLLVLAYLFVFDPYNLKPLFMPTATDVTTVTAPAVTTTTSDDTAETTAATSSAPTALSPAQEAALESVGIAPAAVPIFTAEQLQCFEEVLGAARVQEIKAGATPSVTEFYTAKACL